VKEDKMLQKPEMKEHKMRLPPTDALSVYEYIGPPRSPQRSQDFCIANARDATQNEARGRQTKEK
jgi:hypothetical protein